MKNFFIKKLTTELKTDSTIQNLISRISDVFSDESIKFVTSTDSIRSTKVPLPLLSFDLRQYTRRNWVGINPFIFISEIMVILSKMDENNISIKLTIDQTRAVFIYAIILFLLSFVAINLPKGWIGILFFGSLACICYGFIFLLCINRFIKKEIVDELR